MARGRYSVGDERRQHIVEAAAARFASEGYHRTAMTTIASDVGISEGGLLHHFRSKKHLLVAVAQERFESSARWWDALPDDVIGLATLQYMVDATRRYLAEPGLISLVVLVNAEAADPSSPAHEVYAGRYDIAVQGLGERLRAGIDRDGLDPDIDYDAVARECLAVSDGLQLQWVMSNGTIDIVAGVKAHIDRLGPALRRRGTT
ncbi:TetR/AcrR family transcriptional regulator [Rhodococcus sp. BP-252]|uniref:TetR family transcriptional regulator n=1 Tax=Rhodococcoides kyotonense TaxID=398843 RepID=A0A177YE47_9NOCA|nr:MULTISPECIES: TetR/AcrR family transcriptional regulator [Rhodococcus]MBY6412994.1 TetR/AcrR family transcriptional regulator [Rhodococcus sp. BP-320]MBY6418567.1 TetR/AcrR family transcriptional regulator [Rhodococcus sp. BP-321]MBY6422731.1 TetR/AcrR family transcriptional regulator [Rhodococcus sp. BP-324]MBY6428467.1 TetR/AcrR family transcriptional regulator [Rhodococcus sp. BP-323]MBY6432916.1 TetR/AcrR family transcriptional regulator [Rhodococcus sp. BP-322]